MKSLAVMMLVSMSSYFDSFPQESQFAIDFTTENKVEISKIKVYHSSEDARLAMCIVAPEISRYSRVANAAETFALKTLYVQGKVSDFSIGIFQMKPSFAVSVENEVERCNYLKKFRNLIIHEETERAVRFERVERLSSLNWQLVYLCAFIEIARAKTLGITFANTEEKLKYWATLYNGGLHSSESKIISLYEVEGFPKFSFNSFNYADVCVEFYRNIKYCSFL